MRSMSVLYIDEFGQVRTSIREDPDDPLSPIIADQLVTDFTSIPFQDLITAILDAIYDIRWEIRYLKDD